MPPMSLRVRMDVYVYPAVPDRGFDLYLADHYGSAEILFVGRPAS